MGPHCVSVAYRFPVGIGSVMNDIRVFLIGGTSHTGKTTLAKYLAAQLGWAYRSTDLLMRHPGRPWQTPPRTVPAHVAEHYRTLTVPELTADVLRHYRGNIGPLIEAIVAAHATDPSTDRLVMEGSAILPELVARLPNDHVAAVWLTAGHALLTDRILRESQYETKAPAEQELIIKFLRRAESYNDHLRAELSDYPFASLVIEAYTPLDHLVAFCRSCMEP